MQGRKGMTVRRFRMFVCNAAVACGAAFAFLVAALAGGTPASAGGAHSLLILDANTGAVLIDQAGSEQRYPASLTKMMTLYMVFEALERGSVTMKTRIKVSAQAASVQPSKLDLEAGSDIALEHAVMALITKSANDMAVAIAEHMGGSEPNFARLMTAKARELGMKNTTFRNASGLPDSGQTTTARDMVTLGLRLHDDFPRWFPLFSTRSFSYLGKTLKNHNTLLIQLPGINGIKTGYTSASGFNLVSSYQQDGKHLVGAIFGGQSAGSRNLAMRLALTKALSRASTVKTRKPVSVAAKATVPITKETGTKEVATKEAAARPAPKAATRPSAAKPAAPAVQAGATAAQPPEPAPATPPVVASAAAEPVEALPVAAPPSQPAGPRIDVAKVKAIDVAMAARKSAPPQAEPIQPGARPATAPAAAAQPPAAPPAQAPQPSIQAAVLPLPVTAAAEPAVQQIAAPALRPTPAATQPPQQVARPPDAASPRQPSSFEHQVASLAQNMVPSVPQPLPAAPAPALALPTAATARPPSSLDQQLASLAQSPAAPPASPMAAPSYRLKGPPEAPKAPARVTGAAPSHEIQIGAYASPAEADRRLTAAAAQVPALQNFSALRQSATIGGKVLYRARFGGFDAAQAAQMCAELTRQTIPCVAMRAE